MVSLCFFASFHLSKSHQQDSHFDSSFSKGIDTPPRTTLEPKNWSVGRCFSFSKIEGIFTFQPLVFRVVFANLMSIFFNRRIDWYWAGQIIATSHDLTPNGGLVMEIPLFQGNLGWLNIFIWPALGLVTRRLFPFQSLLKPQDWCEFSGMGQGRKRGAVDVVLTLDVLRSPDGCFFC